MQTMQTGTKPKLKNTKKKTKDGFSCSICKNGKISLKVLPCLHTLCYQCWNKASVNESGDSSSFKCPQCSTPVKGDFEISKKSSSYEDSLTPGLSKKEKSCSCEHVRPFLQNSELEKALKFYCATCQKFACVQCLTKTHPETLHKYDFAANVSKIARQEVQKILGDAQTTKEYFEFTVKCFEGSLMEFQDQKDHAKSDVQNVHSKFLTVVDQQRIRKVIELKEIAFVKREELKKLYDHVSLSSSLLKKTVEDVSKIYDKLDIVQLRDIQIFMKSRIIGLTNKTEELKMKVAIHLDTRKDLCETLVKGTFGTFLIRSESIDLKETAQMAYVMNASYEKKLHENFRALFKLPNLNQNEAKPASTVDGNQSRSLLKYFPSINKRNARPEVAFNYYSSTYFSSMKYFPWKTNLLKINQTFGASTLNRPNSFCLGLNGQIIVADTYNHRTQIYSKTGDFLRSFGIAGKEEGHMWYPRKVAFMPHNNCIVVCDRGSERTRLQIFFYAGAFRKKITTRFIGVLAAIGVNERGQIVAVDSHSVTVFVMTDEGDLVNWFECNNFMREPSDIALHNGHIYLSDYRGHAVLIMKYDGKFVQKIDGDGIFFYPSGIDVLSNGDIVVGNSHGRRFHVTLISKYFDVLGVTECMLTESPRCYGLKVNKNGFIITLSKTSNQMFIFSN